MAAGRQSSIRPGASISLAEFRIMKYEWRAVGRRLQVALDAVSPFDRSGESRRRVLDDAFGRMMQSAMRDRTKEGAVEHSVRPA